MAFYQAGSELFSVPGPRCEPEQIDSSVMAVQQIEIERALENRQAASKTNWPVLVVSFSPALRSAELGPRCALPGSRRLGHTPGGDSGGESPSLGLRQLELSGDARDAELMCQLRARPVREMRRAVF